MATLEQATHKFEVGTNYAMTYFGNSDLHVIWKVLKRTAKTIWVTDGDREKQCRVRVFQGEEMISPDGSYYMAPVLGAKDNDRVIGGTKASLIPVGVVSTGMGP